MSGSCRRGGDNAIGDNAIGSSFILTLKVRKYTLFHTHVAEELDNAELLVAIMSPMSIRYRDRVNLY